MIECDVRNRFPVIQSKQFTLLLPFDYQAVNMSSSESSLTFSSDEEVEFGRLYDQHGKPIHVRCKKTTKCNYI